MAADVSSAKTVTVVDWLLDSDPAIRWQVMRDLIDASRERVAAERARVAREGWGARLLTLQGEDGLRPMACHTRVGRLQVSGC